MNSQEKIKKLLNQTVGKIHYNGWNNRTEYGYHSYKIGEVDIRGQRNPAKRIDAYKKYISFDNKIVVDFGCNVGAMLHHMPEVDCGLGFDYDHQCISAANEISKILNLKNLNFMKHDFDKDCYESLNNSLPKFIDIALILSLGSWIQSWKNLYSLCLKKSKLVILEVNNKEEGAPQLDFFRSKGKQIEEIKNASLDDLTGNFRRKTYIIS
jgi:hypothetical protein